ncbi:MAG: cell division protein ZapA (FtsZ GTPase activity inhibitor) [Planctomycetota bacterium]|jgi:cell division protein ZapA (FtsZ GTPase activity inhibitor)
MEEEQTININLIIADRPYPLKIKVSEEEDIRIAAKEINQKVKDFQKSYSAKDKQDYLAMCALMYGVESITNKKLSASIDLEIDDELTKFEDFLKKF